jgi:hypothetical protein
MSQFPWRNRYFERMRSGNGGRALFALLSHLLWWHFWVFRLLVSKNPIRSYCPTLSMAQRTPETQNKLSELWKRSSVQNSGGCNEAPRGTPHSIFLQHLNLTADSSIFAKTRFPKKYWPLSIGFFPEKLSLDHTRIVPLFLSHFLKIYQS